MHLLQHEEEEEAAEEEAFNKLVAITPRLYQPSEGQESKSLTCRWRLIQVLSKIVLAFLPSSLLCMLSLPREAQGARNSPRRRSGCVWHPWDWLQRLGCCQILDMLAGIWEGLLSMDRPLFSRKVEEANLAQIGKLG